MGLYSWSVGRVAAVHTPPRAVDATRTVNPSRRAVRKVAWTLRKLPERGSIKAQTDQIRYILAVECTNFDTNRIKDEQRNVAEAHLDAGSVGRTKNMDGSQCLCWAVRQRRDLAAILGPGSLGGGQRVARSYSTPRRDRNDGDLAPPRVGAVRVGRGERLGHGRGAVTSDGATRLVERASVCAHPSFFPAPRVRDIPKNVRYCR